jgi:hypothetical protein
MRSETSIQGDRLANALHFLGINFIATDRVIPETIHKHPAQLIKALAQSKEARLRLSIIPLFLDHPEFAGYLPKITKTLDPSGRLILQCYYTAALFFQQKFSSLVEIKQELPDLFSEDLGLEHCSDLDVCLETLAARHQILSQSSVNWQGTYQHAAQIWLRDKTNNTFKNGSFSIS